LIYWLLFHNRFNVKLFALIHTRSWGAVSFGRGFWQSFLVPWSLYLLCWVLWCRGRTGPPRGPSTLHWLPVWQLWSWDIALVKSVGLR